MKKGQIAEGIVKSVEFPNKGMVYTAEGDRVIVKNTIPGQKVSFAVNKVRKGKAEADVYKRQVHVRILGSVAVAHIRVFLTKSS